MAILIYTNRHTAMHHTSLFATFYRHISIQSPLYFTITISEINHSAPIGETSDRKISNSANMTPDVTQKRGIFVTEYVKTPLASYLL